MAENVRPAGRIYAGDGARSPSGLVRSDLVVEDVFDYLFLLGILRRLDLHHLLDPLLAIDLGDTRGSRDDEGSFEAAVHRRCNVCRDG